MEHGGEYPDTMPQAIKLIDAEGRSCIYVPITQDGKVVDSHGLCLIRRMNVRQSPAAHDQINRRDQHSRSSSEVSYLRTFVLINEQ
jgi:hypothetical protein